MSTISSIPAIALPVISRGDMLKRCLESLDYPVDNLIVFVNSEDPSITKTLSELKNSNIRNLVVQHRYKYGRGCGPAFNEVIKAFPHGPYWMLVGADNYFHPGNLAKIDQYCRENSETFYFWASDVIPILTVRGVSTIGLFDENLYPCYFEDSDYVYRIKLAGSEPRGIPHVGVGHGSEAIRGNVTTHTNLDYKFKNEITYSQNKDYYVRKWGGEPGKEIYRSPFNISGCPISFWNFEPEMRMSRLWEEIDSTFGSQRRQFILSYINYVVGELAAREQAFIELKSEDNRNRWRLGVASLARQVAAVPADCIQEAWEKSLKMVAQRYIDIPDLTEKNLPDFDRISITDLEDLFGSEFDTQAHIGLFFLTGNREYLNSASLPL